ncbi:hypothetical protein CR513_31821, partial [Mucuna pruriens]
MPTQGNSPSLEDLMKQLATSNLEFQQTMSSSNMQFQQNMNATIQDVKMQIGKLANTVSQLQSIRSSNLPSQTIPNLRGNASAVAFRSGKELPQLAQQQLPRLAYVDSELDTNSQMLQQDKAVLLPFPTRTLSTRKPEFDEELLKMFRKVEINIPLLDAIKKIPKHAKFLKELCVQKRKKMKGSVEVRGVVSALTRNEDFTAGAQQALLKKCRDPRIFSNLCTIGDCIFADVVLDLGASINVMPTSIYKSLNFDVLVQVNELTFRADFYVLHMEDETSGKGSTLILRRPFLMTAKTKIDVHAGTLSMEFAMKHPIKDHSLFGIDLIDELVEECLQLDNSSEDIANFAEGIDSIGCLGSLTEEADYDEVWEVCNLSNSEDDNIDLADLSPEAKLIKLLDQVCKYEDPKCSKKAEVQVAETEKLFPT